MTLTTSQFAPLIRTDNVATIPAGELSSNVIDLGGTVLVGMKSQSIPVENRFMRFETSLDGKDFFPMVSDIGIEVAAVLRQQAITCLNVFDFLTARFIRLAIIVPETFDLSVNLISRPL